MILEALRQVDETDEKQFIIEDMVISSVLLLKEEVEIFLVLRRSELGNERNGNRVWEFSISTAQNGLSTQYVKGRAYTSLATMELPWKESCERKSWEYQSLTPTNWYDELVAKRSIRIGGCFRKIISLNSVPRHNEAFANSKLRLRSCIPHNWKATSCFH